MANFKVVANLKKSIQPKSLGSDAISVTAALPYVILPTVFGMSGWGAYAVAVAGTWLIGAAFDIPQLRSGALAIGAAHLCYTVAASTIESVTGKPLWRLEIPGTSGALSDAPIMPLQAGATIRTTPEGYQVQSYPQLPEATGNTGMSDYYNAGSGSNPTQQPARSYEDMM